MSEAVIVAVITGLFAIVGNLIISRRSSDDLYAKLDKQSELADQKIHGEIDVIKTELTALKDEVHKHNSVIERVYALETRSALHEDQIKAAVHRINGLERPAQ